jgi:hypothetical protein
MIFPFSDQINKTSYFENIRKTRRNVYGVSHVHKDLFLFLLNLRKVLGKISTYFVFTGL